jgi:hypothetical protein
VTSESYPEFSAQINETLCFAEGQSVQLRCEWTAAVVQGLIGSLKETK